MFHNFEHNRDYKQTMSTLLLQDSVVFLVDVLMQLQYMEMLYTKCDCYKNKELLVHYKEIVNSTKDNITNHLNQVSE